MSRRRSLCSGLVLVLTLAHIFGSCGKKPSGSGTLPDAATPCEGDEDCPTGMVCIGNVCETPVDASVDVAPVTEPNIEVQPSALDFGFAPLRVDSTLPLTIRNTGTADLEITALLIEEVDQLSEYHSDPEGVQSPALIIAPGDELVVQVTLRPEDAELDAGQLRINSNDPDEGTLTVQLTSGYKGLADIEGCVLDLTQTDPEPFTDCTVEETTDEPIIEFGVVQFQEDASQLTVVRNIADGNAPLTVSAIAITDNSGEASHFSLELFWLQEGPGGEATEIPVQLPVFLGAADPLLAVDEDRLYVRILFDGDLDGLLPEEYLVVTSDAAGGDLEIPISGVVSGCPPGTWDINQDPNDGCEYICTYDGPEVCDGADNDCDGEIDSEDAIGCVVYYRDTDNDQYGVTTDARCLCAPDEQTHHTATANGDCDDTRLMINPGMVEQCSTPDDDDCDGDTNDLGAAGCTLYHADQDGDTYGVTTDTACHCAPTGIYTATQSGDCDDTNGQANPGLAEDCNTAFDDNCNGNDNDAGALNCLDYYVDLDSDTFGQTWLSQCLCQPSGSYQALQPGDCNDNNASVHPNMQEDCNTFFDDNCNGDINELNSLNCSNYYLDIDGDLAGVTADFECRCQAMNNYRASVGGDCDDGNASVNPTALENCSTPYDDNCDGDDNDLGATGCTVYYLDADQDTHGLVSSSECRCAAAGSFTSTVPGDCNDGDPAVNPGVLETCDTAWDDNCNGNPNDLGAVNCIPFFWDFDNDAYGMLGSSECRCVANGNYRAPQPGDCQDGDAAINPGAPEVCDYIDNNCMAGADEGFNLLTDVSHCGACDNVCSNTHGATTCSAGVCEPTCDNGWGDCNGDPDDGCETDLTTVTDCGLCNDHPDCPDGFYCQSGVCSEVLPDGDPCNEDEACESTHCTDSYCCDTACDSTCEACDIASNEGVCSHHVIGLDPENECTGTAQATCGLDGSCDGAGACDQWASGTICVTQTCTGNTVYLDDTCNGTGTCSDGGTQDCTPYLCNGNDCYASCSSNTHCVAGFYCTNGVCTGKKPLGATCTASDECESANCVDGVCCDTPCQGVCRACNLATSLGTCSVRPADTDPESECGLCRVCNGGGLCANASDGTDPKTECTTEAESTCGHDGWCNGSGGCRDWTFGTECVAQSCTGNTKYLSDNCNGAGMCVDGGTIDCTPYLCDGTDDCRSGCTNNTHCVTGSWCDAGSCAGQKGLGQPCSGDAECQSGSCADGVCCDDACAATCQACNLTGTVGNCTNVPADQDPAGECSGVCMTCNGTGACAATTAGVDPEGECAQTGADTCGADGQCDGAGACRNWITGTECLAQSCVVSTLHPADSCNGSGTCIDNGTQPCDPYICDGGTACRTDCSVDTHCTTGNYCAAGACASKKPNGQLCAAGNECSSDFCVDGYCCNSNCPSVCSACNVTGVEGTCTDHTINTDPEAGCGLCRVCDGSGTCVDATGGTDPKTECSQDPETSCGLNGACDGSGACDQWTSGTVCLAAYCADPSTQAIADICNGSGVCVDSGTLSCVPFICEGTACRTDCTLDSHCVTGNYCTAGSCSTKKSNGQACTATNECMSGFCADGVCCNDSCGNQCRACNLPGLEGACTPHTLGSDPELECGPCQVCNGGGACAAAADGDDLKDDCAAAGADTCGLDGLCNGSGGCRYWAFGTECVSQSCTGFTMYVADNCNGAGTCVDSGTQSCAPYNCLGDDCRTSCTLQSDCSPGNWCNASNACVGKKPNGQSCASTDECTSGFCVDGVCCNNECSTTCQACNVGGAIGNCTNHTAQTDPESECGLCRVCNGAAACVTATDGTDPKTECLADTQASCGLDGACNGAGVCGFWPASTVCVTQSCANHVQSNTDLCNGSGTCVDTGTQDCSPYECDGSSCRTTCSFDVHCISGFYCAGGACVAKKPDGQSCNAGNECGSDNCVDGVCCNTPCAGDCRACDVTGNVGTCTNHTDQTDPETDCGLCLVCDGAGACGPATTGSDPKSQCSMDSQASCGQDGLCDGTGACRLWTNGTDCNAQLCLGSTLQLTDTCNGAGTCSDGGTTDCSPYICAGTGTTCRTDCALNAHCVAGYYCNGGTCVVESVTGTPCTLDAECGSGFCRDGYCCNNDCAGACRACNNPGTQGTCAFHTTNSDPELECGTCRICNGSGACIDAGDGSDPKLECAQDLQSSCGLDGVCNGAGACGYYPPGSVCQAQTCTGSTKYPADTCNGSGVCTDSGSQNCSPFVCQGSDCGTSCSDDGDCVATHFCQDSSCATKKTNGVPCGAANECTSGNCVDGYCCNNACGGSCQACNVAGSLGACTNHTVNTDPELECGLCRVCNGAGTCMIAADGTDPKTECAQSAESSCGLDGECDGAGACGFWISSTVCAVQGCTGSTRSNTDFCDGSGLCVDNGTTGCDPYVCSGDDCLTSCTLDGHCVTGSYCDAGSCSSQKPNGQTCSGANECQSGFCADGVCCDDSCSGSCRACNIGGAEGTCTSHTTGTDPEVECGLCQICNGAGACTPAASGADPKTECSQTGTDTCGHDGECNGTGGCRYWASGTECVSQTCTGTTKYLADLCSGTGTCTDSGTVSCEPYACLADDCRTNCVQQTDCAGGFYCTGSNTCAAKKTTGQVCGDALECSSGFCADGYCCNASCTGACQACDVAGVEGTCTAHPLDSDPESECGTCKVCSGAGVCINAGDGTDPKTECAQSAQSSCGFDGACNGTGACGFWPNSTVCVAQSCANHLQSNADQCDGAGACSDNGTQDCTPYECSGDSCRSSCASDDHCITGYYCAGGACMLKRVNGVGCSTGNECASGYCVDGLCCNNACSGDCRACNLSGSAGTCAYHGTGTDPETNCGLCRSCNGSGACVNSGAGTDPLGQCSQDAQSSCGQDGWCDGTGACRFWVTGTVCDSPICAGYTLQMTDACNGSGICSDGGTLDCSPYMCAGTGTDCRTDCSIDDHCVSGYYCNGGVCDPESSTGTACTLDTECVSGYCRDGYCCDNDCSGDCRACDRPGSQGTCSYYDPNTDPEDDCGVCRVCNASGACINAADSTDPENECSVEAQSSCGLDGACDGIGACGYYPSGTECIAQSCTGSTKTMADTCNGTGVCADNGTSSCSPYVCAGNDCATTCTGDGDCISTHFCQGSSCVPKQTNGQSCGAGNECTSGYCVDGYCCNNSCVGACRACNVAGSLGACTNHTTGTDPEVECGLCQICNGIGSCTNATDGSDPKTECALDTQASCGLDGVCDGSGACGYWPSATECDAQSCTGSTKYFADYCSGGGTCVDYGSVSCEPYVCAASDCRTDCSLDSHCTAGYYCNAGACVAKQALGQGCGAANECSSGFCADGVCCNETCGSTCQACNQAGSVGTCTAYTSGTDPETECALCQVCNGATACVPATSGTDPKTECAGSAANTCGLDGTCDGSSACRYWAFGTECVSQSCTGITKYLADSCDGAGTCVDAGTVTCEPYVCNGADCRTSCTIQTDCAGGYYCTGSSICAAKKSNGQSCSTGTECTSGECADGVCCNNSCTGGCRACNKAGSVGTCTNHADQTDPETECGLCRVCNGSGSCSNVGDGLDPKNNCTQTSQSTCGLDGSCNGAAACRYWSSSTVCEVQSCANHVQSDTDLCNGSGTCSDAGTQDCSPYECEGDHCRTNCSLDAHCISGFFCASSVCTAKKANGQGCGLGNECASGHCVDGVCCNSTCVGDCRACNNGGSVGTCSNHTNQTDPENDCGLCQVCNGTGACAMVTNGSDPLGQCAPDTQASCDLDGQCDGSGACRLWANGTICNAGVCGGNTYEPADLCNGTGTCSDGGTVDCTPYVCDGGGTACRTNCTVNTHCVTGYFCNGGVCEAENPTGTSCFDDAECVSGFCRDGYCCDEDCGGSCRACNRPANQGTCTYHDVNTDPELECGVCRICTGGGACSNAADNTDPKTECNQDTQESCGLDGACDGGGACGYYPPSTICQQQTCTGSTRYVADTCSGAGVCVNNGTASCSPYICSGDDCRIDCSNHGHCVSGYFCQAGTCISKMANGEICTGGDGEQCLSGNCVDGRCCNSTCSGSCEACNIAGFMGACTDHTGGTDPESECGLCRICDGVSGCTEAAANTDPKNECTLDAQFSCDQDGLCDGNGACGLWAPGTACSNQTCLGSTRSDVDQCNGTGSCTDAGTTLCDPYMCSGNDCLTTCSVDAECITGYFCSGGGCILKRDNGELCPTGVHECSSGNCVDGYCCNGPCGDPCEACNVNNFQGSCTDIPWNTDPDNECAGTCRACNGAGSCMNAQPGTDPEDECTYTTPTGCDTDGECGTSGCGYHPASQWCTAQSCSGNTLHDTDYCSGDGACSDSGTSACPNNRTCNDSSTACRTTCTLNSHCVTGYYCVSGNCCDPVDADAGATCGTGTHRSWTNNNGTPTGGDFVGNLVDVSERWYRFTAYESANDLNVWAWLVGDPSEFVIETYITDDAATNCSGAIAATGTGCGGDNDTHFSWWHSGSSPWTYNDSKTFYIRVYRNPSFGGTDSCSNFTLRVRVGGSQPW